MKPFTKSCFGLLAVGTVLWGAGWAMGAEPLRGDAIPGLYRIGRGIDRMAGRWGWGWGNFARWDDRGMGWSFWEDWDDDFEDDFDDDYDGHVPATPKIPATPDGASAATPDGASVTTSPVDEYDITSLSLELGEGSFVIRDANEHEEIEPFTVEGNYFKHYEVKQDGNEWEVELLGSSRHTEGDILIYLPAGVQFREVDISLGAGTLTIDSIFAKEFDLEVGAGAVRGYVDSPKLSVEAGAGSAKLSVPGTAEDYGYKAEAGLGTIRINDKNIIAGVGEAVRDGKRMLRLEAGMGSISIATTE